MSSSGVLWHNVSLTRGWYEKHDGSNFSTRKYVNFNASLRYSQNETFYRRSMTLVAVFVIDTATPGLDPQQQHLDRSVSAGFIQINDLENQPSFPTPKIEIFSLWAYCPFGTLKPIDPIHIEEI